MLDYSIPYRLYLIFNLQSLIPVKQSASNLAKNWGLWKEFHKCYDLEKKANQERQIYHVYHVYHVFHVYHIHFPYILYIILARSFHRVYSLAPDTGWLKKSIPLFGVSGEHGCLQNNQIQIDMILDWKFWLFLTNAFKDFIARKKTFLIAHNLAQLVGLIWLDSRYCKWRCSWKFGRWWRWW